MAMANTPEPDNPVKAKEWFCYWCGKALKHDRHWDPFCSDECRRWHTRHVQGLTGGLPAEPTQALPGTWAKVEIMRQRVARGEDCFHPWDAPGDGV